jgi:uncharacterized protein (DUF3820 family)
MPVGKYKISDTKYPRFFKGEMPVGKYRGRFVDNAHVF